jgi:diaminopimelate decarboxylase
VGELYPYQIAGVPAQRVVFSGVGKTAQEMAQAVELGIFSFNVESSPELDVLNEVAISLGKRARVALRFNPDVNAKTHPYISTGLKKNKFGMNRKEILAVARDFKNYEALDLVGLSIHIGSQLLNLKPLSDAFDRVSELAAELDLLLESPLEFLDLGGGLGIRYDQEKSVSIRDYTRLICKKFKKAKKKILIEPGRTIAGNSGILVTETVFRKTRDQKDFLVVDAAMNDLLRPALYQSFHGIVPVSERHTQKSAKKKKTDIVGPVCETSDCFASDRLMSTELTTGDQVAILSCGAYGFSMSSNYNTRPRPAEVLVDGSKFRVIRQRETLEDLIRHELV